MSYIYYNPNPLHKHVGDCVIRAISKVTNRDWDSTFLDVMVQSYMMKDIPSSDNVWNAYLRRVSFRKTLLPDECPDCYTVKDFCHDYPNGSFVLKLNEHVVAVIDGDYYDSFDSGEEIVIYYWQKIG